MAAPEVDLVGVVSVPDRPSGRRGVPSPTPVAARARRLGVELLQPARIRDQGAIDAIADLRPALGVLADYGRIVPRAILDLPARGILNVHPSLLPRHRGASPIPATILAGDPTTGVTLIQMDAGLDTGPIVAATAWPLDGDELAPELEARAAEAGAELVRRSLAGWLAGTLAPTPQDEGQQPRPGRCGARTGASTRLARPPSSSARSGRISPGRAPSSRRSTARSRSGEPRARHPIPPPSARSLPASSALARICAWGRPTGTWPCSRSNRPVAGG